MNVAAALYQQGETQFLHSHNLVMLFVFAPRQRLN
jgi:hypothetical protein